MLGDCGLGKGGAGEEGEGAVSAIVSVDGTGLDRSVPLRLSSFKVCNSEASKDSADVTDASTGEEVIEFIELVVVCAVSAALMLLFVRRRLLRFLASFAPLRFSRPRSRAVFMIGRAVEEA